MCGAPKTQEIVQRTELDPALQRMLYGGTLANPRGGFGNSGAGTSGAGTSGAGGGPDMGLGGYGGGGGGGGPDMGLGGRDYGDASGGGSRGADAPISGGFFGFGGSGGFSGGTPGGGSRGSSLYAMGGPVAPQQGIASLNQGQMPTMNGQMPNLSDPMTAATLAMAVRSPQMQYGSIMGDGSQMQTQFNVGGYVEGPGTGTSDSIDSVILQNGMPVQRAKLSDGEFVMTENAVKGAGNGDREAGAARMYELMRQFERGGRV